MTVNQIYNITNAMAKEHLGETAVVNEDLSNVVEIGQDFEDVIGLDNYVKSLNDHIGKMIFVDRSYKGRLPSVLMDSWEFGSIVEKVSAELINAEENEDWELENNTVYEQDIFYKPSVTVTCWNNRVTFEIPISITERQVKSAFNSAGELNAFISMLYNAVEKSMTIRLDKLIMSTICNFIGITLKNAYGSSAFSSTSTAKAVNLLYLYKQVNTSSTLTATTCIYDKDFLRFSSAIMGEYVDKLAVLSELFNVSGKPRFTSADKLHIAMLSEFKNKANAYLQSDTFHNEFTVLPNAETVTFWQGSGSDYAFSSTSKIDVKTSENDTVTTTGILAVMWDRDALGVTCMNRRVKSHINNKAEFYTEWHKMDAGYFNALDENFVVFFVA